MISFFEASLKSLSIHRIGNKSQDEFYVLSEQPHTIQDPTLAGLLMQYFLKPFEKVEQTHQFYHPNNDLSLNEVCSYATDIFDLNHLDYSSEEMFHASTQDLAKYLYEVSSHPKIRSGELFIAHFENIQIEGELHEAIGIFKTETKETYLKLWPNQDGFGIDYEQEGIDINNLQKGCLIFNTDVSTGFKVAVLDQKSANDAIYWKDEFLKVRVINNEYNQTNTILGVFKHFVTDRLDENFEISKASKIDLLNKSIKYFKEKESFDLGEFTNDVIGNEDGIDLFKSFKKSYEEDFECPVPDYFDISGAAVKKQTKSYKATLKLDKNFQINISGSKELIEKGFDDDKAMNYYKVYFREEA